jgi:hypothetical protein
MPTGLTRCAGRRRRRATARAAAAAEGAAAPAAKLIGTRSSALARAARRAARAGRARAGRARALFTSTAALKSSASISGDMAIRGDINRPFWPSYRHAHKPYRQSAIEKKAEGPQGPVSPHLRWGIESLKRSSRAAVWPCTACAGACVQGQAPATIACFRARFDNEF